MSGTSERTERATGHIDTPEGGAMDVYLNGERMEFRDGYDVGVQVYLEQDGATTSVFVKGHEDLGITAVEGEHWDFKEDAFWEDPDSILSFEHKHTDDDDVLLFEATGDDNQTVEIRSVDPDTEGVE